ncbi:MAG: LysR substrate-binding domain-containing protein [Chitinophagales bacterium]|nr:LysR substrate-binding domain-containing protein [Chitinophagales bacterium]
MITITQLEYIVAVDTYRHFANAAEKCMVTQPTLSMQIKKMEDTLGVVLFDRSKQPVMPTDIGKLIIAQARVVLRESMLLENIAKGYHHNVTGKLNIGVIPTLAPYLLPLFIGKLMEHNSGIKLNIKELTTSEIIHQLKVDEIDVGILSTPLHEEHVIEVPLFYEEIKIYTHYNHPLTKLDKVTAADVSRRNDVWMLTDGNCFKNQVVNFCKNPYSTHQEDRVSYESGSLETLKKLVETEGGFTFLPELAMMELSTRQMNQIVGFYSKPPLREIGLCFVRNAAKKDLIEILSNCIKTVVPSEMLDKNRGSIVEWR